MTQEAPSNPKKKSDSIWYPRYIGDYQRKTGSLSLIEHGVYAVLLDHYYSTGKPLPANASRLQNICKAFAPEDVEAMQHVLSEFFVLSEDGYRNERADEELSKRSEISKKRSNSASQRHHGSPKKTDANVPANAPAIAHTATATATSIAIEESSDEDSLSNENLFQANDRNVAEKAITHDRDKQSARTLRSTSLFESWWEKYPRQRRGSKQSAFKSWKRAVAAGVDPQTIHDALDPYLTSKDVADGFACGGDVWLNKERWNDRPLQKLAKPASDNPLAEFGWPVN